MGYFWDDELYHSYHKYIAKIGEGVGAKYFYTRDELAAYKNKGKSAASNAGSAVKKAAYYAVGGKKKDELKEATKQYKTAKKVRNSAGYRVYKARTQEGSSSIQKHQAESQYNESVSRKDSAKAKYNETQSKVDSLSNKKAPIRKAYAKGVNEAAKNTLNESYSDADAKRQEYVKATNKNRKDNAKLDIANKQYETAKSNTTEAFRKKEDAQKAYDKTLLGRKEKLARNVRSAIRSSKPKVTNEINITNANSGDRTTIKKDRKGNVLSETKSNVKTTKTTQSNGKSAIQNLVDKGIDTAVDKYVDKNYEKLVESQVQNAGPVEGLAISGASKTNAYKEAYKKKAKKQVHDQLGF